MKTPLVILFVLMAAAGRPAHADAPVTLELDEAQAALAILEAQAAGAEPATALWEQLWQSKGYRRLLAREASMGRDAGFADALRTWLLDPSIVAKTGEYRAAVQRWREFNATRAGERANAYLPAGVELRATLYPVIKHTRNSFVFDLQSDPAIFMTIDPAHSAAYMEAVMTHELHHVGLSRCPGTADYEALSANQQTVLDWLSIFGEGLAVLATAGDPFRHPHYYSDAREYITWERDVAKIATDLQHMEAFFVAVLDGSLAEDRQRAQLFTFIATEHVPQGPAYTLGWKMAAVVERRYGRDMLLTALCDPRELLRLYNEAATEIAAGDVALPRWSDAFLARLRPAVRREKDAR